MNEETDSSVTPAALLRIADGVVVQQALYTAAKLGIADLLVGGPLTAAELSKHVSVNESAMYRVLRLLAGQDVFREVAPRTFANSALSQFLRTGVPGSIRPILIFRGSEYFFGPFGQILHSVQTGESARTKMLGMNGFDYLQGHPETARIFDEAMTTMSTLAGPFIAAAYDFGAWESVMDVGGGNGVLLASILRVHPRLRGVVADLPHVIERAHERGFLGGELEARSALQTCDFFCEVPRGCRAYLLKSVIADWEDERARIILMNCRRAIPENGVLLIVEFALADGSLPIAGQMADIAMLVLTGGKMRTLPEHRELLASAGFRLIQVHATAVDWTILEAMPA